MLHHMRSQFRRGNIQCSSGVLLRGLKSNRDGGETLNSLVRSVLADVYQGSPFPEEPDVEGLSRTISHDACVLSFFSLELTVGNQPPLGYHYEYQNLDHCL